MADFSAWIGRSRAETETLDARLVRWLAATLERPDGSDARVGQALPAGWHWTLFAPVAAQSSLGRDGHPSRTGDFLPPTSQPRRMWAGSRLVWHDQFRVGDQVTRTSTIASADEKSGRSGTMVFVTLAHRLEVGGRLIAEEEQDLVYRGDASPDEIAALARLAERARAGGTAPEKTGAFQQSVTPDPVMLFRYSAATFNGHRIHSDRDYAGSVEGYPGLVVHGPLIASLLLGFAETLVAPGARVTRFDFRAKRPTFDITPFALHADAPDAAGDFALWSTNNVGEVAVEARARVER
jgi:3-methylfumaryl-CoA hydratase